MTTFAREYLRPGGELRGKSSTDELAEAQGRQRKKVPKNSPPVPHSNAVRKVGPEVGGGYNLSVLVLLVLIAEWLGGQTE